jgi:hypothetical protein
MNLKQVVKNPLSSSTWKQFALGQKGVIGTATATAVLEFGTQLIDRYAPAQVTNIMSKQVMNNAPFLGGISVRDTIVLAPAITSALGAVKGGGSKKGNIMNALAGYGTKVMLRRTGLNPHLLSKGMPSPQNPRVTSGTSINAQNRGLYP